MYKITLISGKNNIEFTFDDWDDAEHFILVSLHKHSPKEMTDGAYEELIVEIEKVADRSDY
jgi:hypothetical protein